jgi:hypothetical protein
MGVVKIFTSLKNSSDLERPTRQDKSFENKKAFKRSSFLPMRSQAIFSTTVMLISSGVQPSYCLVFLVLNGLCFLL